MAKGDILDGKIGEVGSYDLEFKGGKLVAKVQAGAHGISGGAFVEVSSDAVIDAIKKAIPGKVDDFVLEGLKVALNEASG